MDVHEIVNKLQNQATGRRNGDGPAPAGNIDIEQNGVYDVTDYAQATVQVPNTYAAADEGEVVSNGALVSQTAHADVTPTTADQTIDTTLNNSIKVKGDADLVAGNIKKDVEIFGVTGSYEGGVDYLAQRLNGELTSYYSEEVTNITGYAFSGNNIQSLELPNCTRIGDSALRGLSTLTTLKVHKVTNLGTDALNGCTGISVLAIPKCTSITTRSFNNNTSLQTLEIGVLTSVISSAPITTLILRKSTLVALSATTYLSNGIWGSEGTGGTLYVPRDLISEYQAATNWSTILGYANNRILAIEGSQYENYYADGTPIE